MFSLLCLSLLALSLAQPLVEKQTAKYRIFRDEPFGFLIHWRLNSGRLKPTPARHPMLKPLKGLAAPHMCGPRDPYKHINSPAKMQVLTTACAHLRSIENGIVCW